MKLAQIRRPAEVSVSPLAALFRYYKYNDPIFSMVNFNFFAAQGFPWQALGIYVDGIFLTLVF